MWKRTFVHMLRRIIHSGSLAVTFPDGKEVVFGESDSRPVRIRIKDRTALSALCINPNLAVGECYMDGRLVIEDDDLAGFLELLVINVSQVDTIWLQRLLSSARQLVRRFAQHNPVGRSRSNVKHHYDLSDELYELFLDEDRQYSCAYFRDPDESLEDAQTRKKRHIANKLLLKPGLSVLDIGSGWGGMGLTIARDFGCKVLGVTLSTGQHRISNERAREEGLENLARFELTDYRNLESRFDRIVSVGMFEHVGSPHYGEFFRTLKRLLDEGGIALLHTIGRPTPPGTTHPWIAKYIFPGGYIPAMSEVLAAIEREGLFVTDVEVLRIHYAETLKNWHKRFMQNIDRVRDIYDDRFCRMWRFYLISCEMSFRFGGLSVFQFQITRKIDSAPLTRDYLYPPGNISFQQG